MGNALHHLARKHSTLSLCVTYDEEEEDAKPPPPVYVCICVSVGTEELRPVRHRVFLFLLVTAVTLNVSSAVMLGLRSRWEAYLISVFVVFPATLLVRTYLVHYSLRLARACGEPPIRLEEGGLLLLLGALLVHLLGYARPEDVAGALRVSLTSWLMFQLLEAAFILLVYECCGCAGAVLRMLAAPLCCLCPGWCRRRAGADAEASGRSAAPSGAGATTTPERQVSIEME